MKKMTAPAMEVVRFGAEDIIATSEILHWQATLRADGTYSNSIRTKDGRAVYSKYPDTADMYEAIIKLRDASGGWSKIGNPGEKAPSSGTFYYHDDGWVVYRPDTN